MERTTFGLLFYIRRDKTNKRGEAPVFMRLTINGERADASIKRFIEPHAWNSAKGKANEKSRGGKDLNLYLDAISANILRIQRDLELDKKEVSAQIILNRYLGKEQSDRHTLMEVFRAHNEKCRALSGISLAPATVIRYETTLRLTEEFLQKNYKKEDCYLDEVTNQFIEDFEFFLKTVRRCCHNTTTKYLLNFKKIIRIALAKGWMKKDPFAQVHFHFEPVEREFLEKQELKAMLNKEITITRLAQVRDIFCFCCLTGLAFTDVQQLRPEHLVADIHGKIWIRKARQKTKNMCNIPLLDEAQKIIDRYKQPEDELLLEGAGRHLRHSQESLDALRAPYVRNPDTGQRCDNRQRRQDARPCQRQHDAPLCEGSRLVNHARHGGRRRKHGVVARCRTCEVCKGHPAPFPEFRPILRAGSGNRSPVNNKVYYGMQTD